MRIIDWSSDVCSSDLADRPGRRQRRLSRCARVPARVQALDGDDAERDARDAMRPLWERLQPATITASTSNAAPLGSAETSMVERAGYEIGRASCRERVCQ